MSNLQNLPSCGSSLTSERKKRQSSPYFAAVHQGYKVFVTSFPTYPQPFFLVFCMFSFFLLVSLDVLMHNNYWNVALSVHPKRKRNQGAARSFTSANVRSLRASSLDGQFCFDCRKSWLTLLCDWFHPKRKRNQGAARSFTSANVRSLRASSLDGQFCYVIGSGNSPH